MFKKPTVGVFIGRVQPVHRGHLAHIRKALECCELLVIVLGSDCQAKTPKNPWTTTERSWMLRACLTEEENRRTAILPVKDYASDNSWLIDVQGKTADVSFDCLPETVSLWDCDVTLFGFAKDPATKRYLNQFPQWDLVDIGPKGSMDATMVRAAYFAGDLEKLQDYCEDPVVNTLRAETALPIYQELKADFDYYTDYSRQEKAKNFSGPYPIQFQTSDAVVIKSGHILLVRRGRRPGKGLLALPGGFVDPDETVFEGCLRELQQETKLHIPKDELRKRLQGEKRFDDPKRSLRGRIITTAFCFDLGSGVLPKVKGGDDAAKALWLPLRDVAHCESEFFEDHYLIINHFISRF